MRFAILRCVGYSGTPPTVPHLTEVLQPYLLEKGWELIYFSYNKGVASVVGIIGNGTFQDLKDVLEEIYQYCNEHNEEFQKTEELRFANLGISNGIEIETFTDSTSQNAELFVACTLSSAMEKASNMAEEISKKLKSMGKVFQGFS